MANIIQMIRTSEDNYIFLIGFTENNELIFRSSRNIKQLQTEEIIVKDDMVHIDPYFFHISYLQKFLNEINTE